MRDTRQQAEKILEQSKRGLSAVIEDIPSADFDVDEEIDEKQTIENIEAFLEAAQEYEDGR